MQNPSTLPDGIYPAHLVQAKPLASAAGLPLVEFLWQLDGTNRTLKSFLHLRLSDGSPNEKGVAFTRRWAPDWDGVDPSWFSRNLDFASKYQVKLTVENRPWARDPTRIFPTVKWVNPRGWHAEEPTDRSAPAPRPLAVEALAEVPEDVEPSMVNAWSVFSLLYAGESLAVKEADWLAIVHELVPGTDQIDFTEDNWRTVLAYLRTRTHTRG